MSHANESLSVGSLAVNTVQAPSADSAQKRVAMKQQSSSVTMAVVR